MKKSVFFILGFVALGLGIIGIPLPGFPTTVFLIIAAYCFARSSPRMHAWLLNQKHLGPFIRNWEETGTIPKNAKRFALLMTAMSAMIVILTIQSLVLKWVILAILVIPTVILLRLKVSEEVVKT